MTKPVVIVGGGLAGLYAGYLLEQRHINFKIIEADSRPGGRIFCQPYPDVVDNKLDLGPAWFWPHQTEMLTLLQSLGVDYFEQYHAGEALFEADSQSPIERFVPSYMESFRVAGGMQRLVDKIISQLPDDAIELNCMASNIELKSGVWEIACNGQSSPSLIADRVIIATPPRVIADKLKMPDDTLLALKNQLDKVPTWMAAQAKYVACYRNAFWRLQGLSGQAFSRLGPMVEIHDASAGENDCFALFGFIGVASSQRKNITTESLKQACLNQLIKIFGEDANDTEQTYLTDWASNPLIASAADINEPPGHPQISLAPYRQALIDNGIFFGGSEVATQDPGYLRGAIIAASDAVTAILSQPA